MKELTKRQNEVYQFILDFIEEHNYPPTVREVAARFSISVKAAFDRVSALKKKDRIRAGSGRQRTMEIVIQEDADGVPEKEFVDIPLLGEVAAGRRILVEENDNGSIRIHKSLLNRNKKYFALKVKGDSMEGIGVMDGDTVVIEKKDTANDGDVVVVDVDEGRALKRFYRQANRIKLQSENAKYPPMYSMDVRVLGILAGLFRSY
jgi:repressor LexA